MLLIKKKADLNHHLTALGSGGATVGFVPTMGALHPGHLSLIAASKSQNGVTVCSIFVNPTQFNNAADFQKYPVTIENDIALLHNAGCDILFLPAVDEMYPGGLPVNEHYDLGFIETVLEGPMRPGHFQGVCQVVSRLFKAVRPNHAYFGSKDYQQCMVIERLVQLLQPDPPLQLHFCPTLREADGLAMSSRNMRLNAEERAVAPVIYKTLQYIKANLKPGPLNELLQEAGRRLIAAGLKPDYITLARAAGMQPVTEWDGTTPLVCLVAAFLNDVRLIDNMVME